MFGMPRDASQATKLALMLRHLGLQREAEHAALLDAVCASLLDHLARRARVGLPVRKIRGAPLVEPSLRDAAFVLGAIWRPDAMARYLSPSAMADYADRTADWLRPVVETYGLAWPWDGDERRVA